jgi:hypothetical protein
LVVGQQYRGAHPVGGGIRRVLLVEVALFGLVHWGLGVKVTVQGLGVELAELNGDVPAVVPESIGATT